MKGMLKRQSIEKTNKQKLFLDGMIVYIATISDRFAFFLINVLVARYLTVEAFGEYTTALNYATFFSTFLNLGINQSVIRSINLDPDHESEHFTNSFIIRLALSFVVYAVMAGSMYFTNYNSNIIFLIFVFGIVRIVNEFLNGIYSYYDAKQLFINSSLFNISFSISFLIATFLVVVFKGTYFHIAYSRLAIAMFFFAAILIFTLRRIKMVYVASKMREFIRKTIPFVLYSIYTTLQTRVNIIMISLILGTVYTGIFNNAYIFFTTLTFIPGNFNRVIVPYLYRHTRVSNKYQYAFDNANKFFGILSFYIMILFLLFSKPIVNIAFGSKYFDSIDILKILAFGVPFLFNVGWSIIIAIDKQKVNTNIVGISALVNIALNIVMMIFWNIKGAAIAAVLTQGIVFLLSAFYLRAKNIVTLNATIINITKLIIISFMCFIIQKYLLSSLFWMISASIISIMYLSLVMIFVLDRKNFKLIQSIVFGK